MAPSLSRNPCYQGSHLRAPSLSGTPFLNDTFPSGATPLRDTRSLNMGLITNQFGFPLWLKLPFCTGTCAWGCNLCQLQISQPHSILDSISLILQIIRVGFRETKWFAQTQTRPSAFETCVLFVISLDPRHHRHLWSAPQENAVQG